MSNNKAKVHEVDARSAAGAFTMCGRKSGDVLVRKAGEGVTCVSCADLIAYGNCGHVNAEPGDVCARAKGHTGRHACRGKTWENVPAEFVPVQYKSPCCGVESTIEQSSDTTSELRCTQCGQHWTA